MYSIPEHHTPPDLAAALELLALRPEVIPIAGGTDLLVKQRHNQSTVSYMQLRQLEALRGIELLEDGSLSIGAACTFGQLASSPEILAHIPILAQASLSMGGPQIRNAATIGGNLCNGAVSADSAAALLVLEAELELVSQNGTRILPVASFHRGPGEVDLAPGELLTRIRIAPRPLGEGGCYLKYSMRKAMDIATLGVAAACVLEEGRFAVLRLGATVVARTPLRLRSAEAVGNGIEVNEETVEKIAKAALADISARTSWRASKEFRRHILTVYCKRAVELAVEGAKK